MNDNDEWPHPDQVKAWWRKALREELMVLAALFCLSLLAALWIAWRV